MVGTEQKSLIRSYNGKQQQLQQQQQQQLQQQQQQLQQQRFLNEIYEEHKNHPFMKHVTEIMMQHYQAKKTNL